MTTTTSTFSPQTMIAVSDGSELSKRVSTFGRLQQISGNPWLYIIHATSLLILSDVETKHNNLVAKYHPNFWMDGKWRCCQQTEKLAAGCHVYDPLGCGLYYFLLIVPNTFSIIAKLRVMILLTCNSGKS